MLLFWEEVEPVYLSFSNSDYTSSSKDVTIGIGGHQSWPFSATRMINSSILTCIPNPSKCLLLGDISGWQKQILIAICPVRTKHRGGNLSSENKRCKEAKQFFILKNVICFLGSLEMMMHSKYPHNICGCFLL